MGIRSRQGDHKHVVPVPLPKKRKKQLLMLMPPASTLDKMDHVAMNMTATHPPATRSSSLWPLNAAASPTVMLMSNGPMRLPRILPSKRPSSTNSPKGLTPTPIRLMLWGIILSTVWLNLRERVENVEKATPPWTYSTHKAAIHEPHKWMSPDRHTELAAGSHEGRRILMRIRNTTIDVVCPCNQVV